MISVQFDLDHFIFNISLLPSLSLYMVRNSTTLCVKYNTHEHIQGEDSVEYFLGLTPSGIIVLRNKSTVAHYYWPRISKVYFKGRYFMIRVCDKNVSTKTEPQLARMLMDSRSVLRAKTDLSSELSEN